MLVKSLSNFFTVPNWVGNSWERLSCETSGASCLGSCCKCHKHLHSFSCGISTPLPPRSAGIQRQRDAQKHKPLERMERNRGVPCTGCFIYRLICIFARIPVCNLSLNAKWQYHCFNFTFSTSPSPETRTQPLAERSLDASAQGQARRLGERMKRYRLTHNAGKVDSRPSPSFPWFLRPRVGFLHNRRRYRVGATDWKRRSDTSRLPAAEEERSRAAGGTASQMKG